MFDECIFQSLVRLKEPFRHFDVSAKLCWSSWLLWCHWLLWQHFAELSRFEICSLASFVVRCSLPRKRHETSGLVPVGDTTFGLLGPNSAFIFEVMNDHDILHFISMLLLGA